MDYDFGYIKSVFNAFPLNNKEANFNQLLMDWITDN